MNTKEINVYVIELEQPFENWYGTLKDFNFMAKTCIVINNKGKEVEVNMKEVQEVDTNLPIYNFLITKLRDERILKFLEESNLSKGEAKLFLSLSKKIKPEGERIEEFKQSFERDIPFEGGMSSTEAIIGLIIALKEI